MKPIKLSKRLAPRLLAGGSVAAILAFVSSASADSCFAQPVGVPGLFGPPNWIDGTPSLKRTELNEPRWLGAPLQPFANDPGGSDKSEGGYRLMVDSLSNPTELAVSIQTGLDSNPSTATKVFFGFTTNSTTARIISIPYTTAAGQADPVISTGFGVTNYSYNSGSWGGVVQGFPNWVNNLTVGTWSQDRDNKWGIQFKIKLTESGIPKNAPFKIFVGLARTSTGGQAPVLSTPYITDNSIAYVDTVSGVANTIVPANIALWENVTSLSGGCPTDGVSFASRAVYTSNTDASGNALPDDYVSTRASGKNNFTINLNYPNAVDNQVNARIKIANWGSLATKESADWTEITPSAGVANSGSLLNGSQVLYSCNNDSTGKICGIITPKTVDGVVEPHQCMLVALNPKAGSSVKISTPLVYRNMTFSSLSKKDFVAEISTRGLRALTGLGGQRDIYVEVDAPNLPALGDLPMFLNSFAMTITRLQAQGLWPLDPDPLGLGPQLTLRQRLRRYWPTYDVHVYYQTFRKYRSNGKVYDVVSPMYPFTYYFDHAGPLFGYSHASGPTDALYTPAGPNTFKVRVNEDGKFHVHSGVNASELPKSAQALAETACYWFPWACGIPQTR